VGDVHDYLRGATRDAELARDLTAETFARTLESLGRFRGLRPQSGRVYVFRVAQRLVAEHARSRTAELDACRRLGIAPPSDDADGRDAIAALTPDQREAVGLCVLLDREYACGGALTCGPNLSKSVPITFMIESGPGHPTVVTGLARDDVRAVAFEVGGELQTVPVKDNAFWYRDPAGRAYSPSFTVEFADGITAAYPPSP
jgi:Sigma-70 region 2